MCGSGSADHAWRGERPRPARTSNAGGQTQSSALQHGIRQEEQEHGADTHEQRWRVRPLLRLIGPPHRESRQERPSNGEAEQHHRRGEVRVDRGPRDEGEEDSGREAHAQREHDDLPDADAAPSRFGGTCLVFGGPRAAHPSPAAHLSPTQSLRVPAPRSMRLPWTGCGLDGLTFVGYWGGVSERRT